MTSCMVLAERLPFILQLITMQCRGVGRKTAYRCNQPITARMHVLSDDVVFDTTFLNSQLAFFKSKTSLKIPSPNLLNLLRS